MNKILFRGFHPNENGETIITVKGEKIRGKWEYGFYMFLKQRNGCFGQTVTEQDFDRHTICTQRGEPFEVIPETVGQFVTTDKNGKDLFEGDMVKNNRGELMLIEWVQKYTRFTLTCKEKGIIIATFVPEQCELIGNKWECAE